MGAAQLSFVSPYLGYALIDTAPGGLELVETTDGGADWHHVSTFSAAQPTAGVCEQPSLSRGRMQLVVPRLGHLGH